MPEQCKNCGANVGNFFSGARRIMGNEYSDIKKQYPDTSDEICSDCSPRSKSAKLKRISAESSGQNKVLDFREIEAEKILVSTINIITSIAVGEYKIVGIVSAQTIKSTGLLLNLGIDGLGGGIDFSNTKSTKLGEEELIKLLRFLHIKKAETPSSVSI
jgi:hypothetical protein